MHICEYNTIPVYVAHYRLKAIAAVGWKYTLRWLWYGISIVILKLG